MKPRYLWLVWLASLAVLVIAIVADDGVVGFPLADRWPYLPAEVRSTLISSAAAAVLIQLMLVGAYVLYLSRRSSTARPIQAIFVALLSTASPIWLALMLGNVYEAQLDNARQGPLAISITMLSVAALPIVAIFALRIRGWDDSERDSSD